MGNSPDELFQREARQRNADAEALRHALERAAQFPNEVHSVINCGTGVSAGEKGHSVFQVVKADGIQLHVDIHPQARRALIRALEEEEERVAAEGNGAGSGLVVPGE